MLAGLLPPRAWYLSERLDANACLKDEVTHEKSPGTGWGVPGLGVAQTEGTERDNGYTSVSKARSSWLPMHRI